MKITKIKIDSFGSLRDREFNLERGINLIEGSNEAGKTSLAMFIKFIFYGLSGRASDAFPMSERRRFVNWDTGRASGSLEFESDSTRYRIERVCGDTVREEKAVIDLSTGTKVKCPGEPGNTFLGVPENVFVNTVFVRQLGTNSIDNAEVRSAIENILSSADEKVSVKKVIGKFEKVRVQLRHKVGSGGDIPRLEEEIGALELALDTAEKQNASIIETEAKLNDTVGMIVKRENEISELERLLQICEDVTALRERQALREALERHSKESGKLDKAMKTFRGDDIRKGIAEVRAGLEGSRKDLDSAEAKLDELRESANSGDLSEADCTGAGKRAHGLLAKSKTRRTIGTVLASLAGVTAIGGISVILAGTLNPAIVGGSMLIASGTLLIVSVLLFFTASEMKKQLGELLNSWDADSVEELDTVLKAKKEHIYSALLAKAQIESAENDAARASGKITELDKKAREILTMLPSLSKENTDRMDCDEVLSLCEKEAERITAELSAQRENLAAAGGECRSMASRLEKYDYNAIALRELELSDTPEWEKAKTLTPHEVERLALRLKMARGQLQSFYQNRETYKAMLAEVRATAKSPADIAEKIEAKRKELDEKKLRFDAVRLAIDTLEESGERLRANLMPRIVEKASAMFSAVTLGKYSTLGVSPDFEMDVTGDTMTRSADYLSAGSADAAYVCLRIALAETVFGKTVPPVIFDESFAKIDEDRLERIFSLLCASGEQMLVFTCRQSEAQFIPAKNVVSL